MLGLAGRRWVDVMLWPEAGFPLDRQLVADTYGRMRAALADNPLLVQDAARFGVSVDDLDRRMASPPDDLDGASLWTWLDGPDQYRWAGLSVLTGAYRPA